MRELGLSKIGESEISRKAVNACLALRPIESKQT